MKKYGWMLAVLIWSAAVANAQPRIGGIWNGKLNAGMQKLEIVFHFVESAEGECEAWMNVPAQGVKGIRARIKVLTADSVNLEVPLIQAAYAGRLDGDRIRGIFIQRGWPMPLELEPGDVAPLQRPQEPAEPYPYRTREVQVHNPEADVWLSATLTYPVGHEEGKSVPLAVMVTGSGSQDRNEELFGHKPFLVIADYLARRGIATLRYDDRGTGRSGGTPTGCTSEDYAADAACGVRLMKESGEFSRVGVLGHSEGGMIAFMLAARGEADFVVSLAGPGIPGDTLLAEQQNAILRSRGILAQSTAAGVRRQAQQEKTMQNEWMAFFLDYDPRPDLERITVPVMAVNGSNDLQVLPASNLRTIRELLSDKNAQNLFREYPDLNHLFQHCTPETAMDYYNIAETFSEEVMQDIAAWINGL